MEKELKYDAKFEHCYGNGVAAKTYKHLESKITDYFRHLTFSLLVELYIKHEMQHNEYFQNLEKLSALWTKCAKDLRILDSYPYDMNTFPHTHPYSKQAAAQGKKRLGAYEKCI